MYRIACALLLLAPLAGAQSGRLLFRKPALSRTQIVFSYAGDLWSVPREGGEARHLTAGQGVETDPVFSPDGSLIAFTGEYDGNVDVFVMPAAGGVPRRLTYHPGQDAAVGWTPDGKRVLFVSARAIPNDGARLYTLPVEGGGLPEELPLPIALEGSYSPDGSHLAYVPLFQWQEAWKRYRGGQTKKIWIADLSDSSVAPIPRENSNDFAPMWIADKVYFLSDRNGPVTLFRYDPSSKKVDEVIKNSWKDIEYATAGPGGIVYEQFGQIHIFDLATQKEHKVDIEMAADLTEVRPHFQNVSREIRDARISATGVRAVFEAHGEILSVPADKGDIRDLTNSPGVMERSPAWSPDGKSIAYFSDESGEYALHIKSQTGEGETRKIELAGHSAYYSNPQWSPDSKHIAFDDNQLHLWDVDVAAGKLTKVDTDYISEGGVDFAWSGDSKWIAYTKSLPNRLHAVVIYSLESGQGKQVTDGMSDARHPAFDRDGQYLYFTASTNYGPTQSGLDMTSDEHEVTSSVYLMVLG